METIRRLKQSCRIKKYPFLTLAHGLANPVPTRVGLGPTPRPPHPLILRPKHHQPLFNTALHPFVLYTLAVIFPLSLPSPS